MEGRALITEAGWKQHVHQLLLSAPWSKALAAPASPFAPRFVLGSAGNLLTRLLLGGERRLEAAAPSADSG